MHKYRVASTPGHVHFDSMYYDDFMLAIHKAIRMFVCEGFKSVSIFNEENNRLFRLAYSYVID